MDDNSAIEISNPYPSHFYRGVELKGEKLERDAREFISILTTGKDLEGYSRLLFTKKINENMLTCDELIEKHICNLRSYIKKHRGKISSLKHPNPKIQLLETLEKDLKILKEQQK